VNTVRNSGLLPLFLVAPLMLASSESGDDLVPIQFKTSVSTKMKLLVPRKFIGGFSCFGQMSGRRRKAG